MAQRLLIIGNGMASVRLVEALLASAGLFEITVVGAEIQPGQTVAVQLLAFSAADGKQLDSSWDAGTPLTFVPGSGKLPPGLEKAVEGMKVGGRRQVDIPFADAFGAAGNSNLGLPASTDLIMVLDLIAVY